MSRDQIEALQTERLNWTLHYAYENVPAYQELFDEHLCGLEEGHRLLLARLLLRRLLRLSPADCAAYVVQAAERPASGHERKRQARHARRRYVHRHTHTQQQPTWHTL